MKDRLLTESRRGDRPIAVMAGFPVKRSLTYPQHLREAKCHIFE